ncbi:MAG: NADP-dependent oxidoreductase [Chloroflexota bacterium]|nr:NADP-dependent oxidoreductase [Chloroflexota bacterium]
MRAQLLSAFGAPDVFTLAEAPAPVPTRGQLRVRIAAIGINSLETKIRAGQLNEHFPISLPAILGKEFAGTVEWSPDGGGEFAVGDRVAGFADTGVYAEYALARPDALARVPDALTLEQAAALPVAVETATRGIAALEVQPGWTVVVNGATGNVGSAAVQLLAAQGMTVIGTASARNLAYLAALGAVPVAYGEGVATRLRAAAPAGIDAVFDVAGHGFVPTAIELTGDPSRIVTIADFAAAPLGVRVSTGSTRPASASFAPALEAAAAGAFRVSIARVFPLADMALAHELVETGYVRGKVIVTVQATRRLPHDRNPDQQLRRAALQIHPGRPTDPGCAAPPWPLRGLRRGQGWAADLVTSCRPARHILVPFVPYSLTP